MNDIDHSFFRKKLFEFTNKTFDIVSTVDHPYTSPPIRLIDCHHKLKTLCEESDLKSLVCIWDVNFPNSDRYKYELTLDVGIFSSADSDFLIFSDKCLYPLQRPKLIDFLEFEKRTWLVLKKLQNLKKSVQNDRNKRFKENLEKIISLYVGVISISQNGTDFYKHLLKDLYALIGFTDLANFLAESTESYFSSAITQKWIPYCLRETNNASYGFLNLLKMGIFKKPCFRDPVVSTNETSLHDPKYIKKNIHRIIEDVEKNNLIPSYEIFFWTLFLANIKHFGNDYSFFQKIAPQNNLNLNNESIKLQLTEYNQDCRGIVRFEKDTSFNCFPRNGEYIVKKNNHLKSSRISSVPALYCHLGDNLGNIIRSILDSNSESPYIIKMGE